MASLIKGTLKYPFFLSCELRSGVRILLLPLQPSEGREVRGLPTTHHRIARAEVFAAALLPIGRPNNRSLAPDAAKTAIMPAASSLWVVLALLACCCLHSAAAAHATDRKRLLR